MQAWEQAKVAARVDRVHQVEALHRRRKRAGQADRTGVVDQDIDAAEMGRGLGRGFANPYLVAHVDHEGKRVAACGANFLGRRVDGAGQLGVGLVGLCRDRHVGAVACRAPPDREPDVAACAGDEQGLACEISHGRLPLPGRP